jgi:FKBP-type peptidyl-prolyl cis-trans isomerase 2
MPVKNGDFILIDYSGRVKETGELFDTTIEEIAKNENLHKSGDLYEPRLVVIGEGWILKAFEEGLMDSRVGKKESVEIPPNEAFGNRDPEKVSLTSLRRLTSKGIQPQIGMRVEIDGKLAIIRTIGSGRVQLDYNPPLAGKTLIYDYTILKKIRTKKERISALIHRRIPLIDIKRFDFKTTRKEINIDIPVEAFYLDGIQLAKRGIVTDIQKFYPQTSTIKFIETFEKQKSDEE